MNISRILLIFAGLVVLAGGVAVFLKMAQRETYYRNNTSVSVGKPREANEGKPEQTQTIRYSSPEAIRYFPYHVITVSPSQRSNEQKPSAIIPQLNHAAETELRKGEYSSEGYGGGREYQEYINLVFLDKDYRHVHTLLNRKGLILEVWYPSSIVPEEKPNKADSLPKAKADSVGKDKSLLRPSDFPYIFYAIVFEDTNDDKRLDKEDVCDLYMSDIDGRNLRKVGKGIDIWSFSLWKHEKRFFVTYFERKDALRRKRFAFYDIAKGEFTPIESTNGALDKVEQILLK